MRNSFTSTQWSPRILGHRIRKDFKHFQWISLEARLMRSAQLRENSALSLSLPLSLSLTLNLSLLCHSLFTWRKKLLFIFLTKLSKQKCNSLQKCLGKLYKKTLRIRKRKSRERAKERNERQRERGRARNRVKVSESESTNIYEMLKVLMPKCLLTQIENGEEKNK